MGRHSSVESVERMMEMADKDGTGTLDYSEFIDILLKEGIAYSSEKENSEEKEKEDAED